MSVSKRNSKTYNHSKRQVLKHFIVAHVLPDPAICRGKSYPTPPLVECLVEQRPRCRYATRFGGRYFCQHPQRIDIAVRTETQKRRKTNCEDASHNSNWGGGASVVSNLPDTAAALI